METPLDVLSRAASFVDVRDSVKTCSPSMGIKRPMAPANMPSSDEVPSKFYKYHRMRWREEEKTNESNTDKTDRKCMGTQTAVSGIHDREKDFFHPRDQDPSWKTGQNSPRNLMDLDGTQRVNHYGGPPSGVCLSPHLPGPVTPDTPDNDSLPLNLSVSAPNSARTEKNRDVDGSRGSGGSGAGKSWNSAMNGSQKTTYQVTHHTMEHDSQGPCDSAIEEHFQRSLGKHYSSNTRPNKIVPTVNHQQPKYNQQQPPSNQQPPMYNQQPMVSQSQHLQSQSQQQRNQSRTQSHSSSSQETKLVIMTTPTSSAAGSVDDHFTKSLGDTWTKIKDEKDSNQLPSVDDHFAKALGDQWLQIKRAQKNGEDTTHRPPNT